MSLRRVKIEHHLFKNKGAKAGVHKKMKKDRNRKLRRTPIDKPVEVKKYDDYEF